MVKILADKTKTKIGIKIFYNHRAKFDLMVSILKSYGFKCIQYPKEKEFLEEGEWWYIRKISPEVKDALDELREMETLNVPKEILGLLDFTPETQYYRIPYRGDLLKKAPLGEFQVKGIKKTTKQSRLLNAFKMGLGKSYTTISALNHLWEYDMIDKILVVAPSESVYNFKREILSCATFPLTEEEIYIANVDNREPFQDHVKIVIMTYRSFLMLSDDAYYKKTKKRSKKYTVAPIDLSNWGTNRAIVLDESHNIKEPRARQTKALHLHKHFFKFRYLLSGTPYPNGVENLYSQISFLDPNIVPDSYYSWLPKIANLGNRWSEYAINSYKTKEVEEFLESVKPWIMREFVEGNLNLPDQHVKKIYIEMTPLQREIYQRLISYIMVVSKEEHGRVVMKEVYNRFPEIMLALDNPCLLKGKFFEDIDPKLSKLVKKWKFEDHSKLEACSSLLDRYIHQEKKKVILWTGHPMTNQQLNDYYKKYNPISIHGQIDISKGVTKIEYRDQLLEKFKSNPNHHLLIASFQMLSSAVNIVEASRSINFDRSWSFLHWAQLKQRNHRYGTTEEVIVNPIIIDKTLEEKQDRVLERKESLDKELLNNDSLSQEQWKALFEGRSLNDNE